MAYNNAKNYAKEKKLNLSADDIAKTTYVYYNGTGGGGPLRWQQKNNYTWKENDDGFWNEYKKLSDY